MGESESDWEAAPVFNFTAAEAKVICGALRRWRHRGVVFWEPGPSEDDLDEVLDKMFNYWTRRQRWENLYLPPADEVPF